MASTAIPIPQATATSGAQPAAKALGGVPPIPQPATGAQPVALTNPMVPPGVAPATPGATNAATMPNTSGGAAATQDANLLKQETDIFGAGVGGSISSLVNNISGVNSQSIADYTASLQPQMANAQANLNATMGASGVSGNSTIAALGDASLQAQETSAIAGETAQLRQSGQQLEAGILTGQEQAAAQEVATSGWDVFGQVLNSVAQDAPGIMKAIPGL